MRAREELEQECKELRREAEQGFLEKYGLTVEEVTDIIARMDDKMRDMMSKFFNRMVDRAKDSAFGTDPMERDKYIQMHGLVSAVRAVQFDFQGMDEELNDYMSQMAALQEAMNNL